MIALLYFFYFMLFMGIDVFSVTNYIETLNLYVRLYVCGFLILRFHPFQKEITFSKFDQQIVFSSAVFLLMTIGLDKIQRKTIESTQYIHSIGSSFKDT